jgi:hypothetical protein
MDDVDNHWNRTILAKCVATLQRRGFSMRQDQEVLSNYPSLARDHWEGKKGDLKVKCSRGGRHVEVEMFGPGGENGGPYRFARFASLPRSTQLLCIVILHRIARMLGGLGFAFDGQYRGGSAPVPVTLRTVSRTVRDATLSPLETFNSIWGSTRYQRDESGWPTEAEYLHPCWINDGNRGVRVGSTVYFIHKGRLLRGVAYPNMNGMWWVDTGAGRIWPQGGMLLSPDVPTRPNRDQSCRMKRLREELDKAVKTEAWKRVESIGRALQMEADSEQ